MYSMPTRSPVLRKWYFSPALALLGWLFSIGNCSTIQLQEGEVWQRTSPEWVAYVAEVAQPKTDPLDHKLRKRNKSRPDITVLFDKQSWDDSLTPDAIDFFQNEILRLARENKVSTKQPDVDKPISLPKDRNFFREEDVDAYLVVSPISGKNLKFQCVLKDSVNDKTYGEFFLEWRFREDEGVDSSRPPVIWNSVTKQQYVPQLGGHPVRIPELTYQPSPSEWNSVLARSLQGKIHVFSSSTDTKILLNGVEIGDAPLRDYPITNGPHRIQLAKPGVEPISKFIQVRAGETLTLHHIWEEDWSTGNLQVTSYPPGLDLWVDGEKKGPTQQYLNEIIPGEYVLELSKEFLSAQGDREDILYSESRFSIPAKSSRSISLPYHVENILEPEYGDFWEPTGRSGYLPSYKPLLGFQSKTSRLVPGDYGFTSAYLFPDTVEVDGVFEVRDSGNAHSGFYLNLGYMGFLLERRGDMIGLFRFSDVEKTGRSLGVWKFREGTKPEEQKFVFRTQLHEKEPKIVVRLGNREIHTEKWESRQPLQLAILTRGEAFFRGIPFRNLKITYSDIWAMEKKKSQEKR